MRRRVIAMLLVAASAGYAIGCSGASVPSATPQPTIDVTGLTPGEIATRALAALVRDGQITHIEEVQSGSRIASTVDLWIDWNGERARLDEYGFASRIFANGVESMAFDDKLINMPAAETSSQERLVNAFGPSPTDYLLVLRRSDATAFAITSTAIGGRSAILADITVPLPSSTFPSPSRNRIYLDATFLPLREEDTADSSLGGPEDVVTTFVTDFVSPSSLPGDFFDKTAAFGIGQSPVDRLSFARDTGYTPYWLDATFENATLTRVSGERHANSYYDGARFVTLNYSLQAGGTGDLPCDAYIVNRPKATWQKLSDRRRAGVAGENPHADVELDNFDVSGGHAQIIEEHRIDVLPVTPGAEGNSPPEPTAPIPSSSPSIADLLLAPPPRGDVADTVGRLTTKDYVIEARLSCRGTAEEKKEPLKRILAALRAYPN